MRAKHRSIAKLNDSRSLPLRLATGTMLVSLLFSGGFALSAKKYVAVDNNGTRQYYTTMSGSVSKLLSESGVVVMAGDQVTPGPAAQLYDGMVIHIEHVPTPTHARALYRPVNEEEKLPTTSPSQEATSPPTTTEVAPPGDTDRDAAGEPATNNVAPSSSSQPAPAQPSPVAPPVSKVPTTSKVRPHPVVEAPPVVPPPVQKVLEVPAAPAPQQPVQPPAPQPEAPVAAPPAQQPAPPPAPAPVPAVQPAPQPAPAPEPAPAPQPSVRCNPGGMVIYGVQQGGAAEAALKAQQAAINHICP